MQPFHVDLQASQILAPLCSEDRERLRPVLTPCAAAMGWCSSSRARPSGRCTSPSTAWCRWSSLSRRAPSWKCHHRQRGRGRGAPGPGRLPLCPGHLSGGRQLGTYGREVFLAEMEAGVSWASSSGGIPPGARRQIAQAAGRNRRRGDARRGRPRRRAAQHHPRHGLLCAKARCRRLRWADTSCSPGSGRARVSSASMNPVRSLSPDLVRGDLSHLWVSGRTGGRSSRWRWDVL